MVFDVTDENLDSTIPVVVVVFGATAVAATPSLVLTTTSCPGSIHRQQQRRFGGVLTKQWWQQHFQPAVSNAVVATELKPKRRQQQQNIVPAKTNIAAAAAATTNSVTTTSDGHRMTVANNNNMMMTTALTNKKRHRTTNTKSNNRNNNMIGMIAIVGVVQRYIVVLMVSFHRTIQTIGKDWYTGYYLRTTFERVEHQYHTQYDIPACLRSIGRFVVHCCVLTTLGRVMEEMVGLTNVPCSYGGTGGGGSGGCHWWCGLLWLFAVTGPGHAIGVAIAIWVQGLRLQLVDSSGNASVLQHQQQQQHQRPSLRHILSRPGRIIRYIIDPDQWFREVLAARKHDSTANPVRHALQPFDPEYRMFPATWSTLRILQMIAIAKEMYGTNTIMHTFMRQVLFQQAFCDEWYRVVMCEKRVAWGIVIMIGYTISTMSLFWNMMHKPAHIVSSISILMMAPYVLAVLISFWMNILVYFERRQTSRLSDHKMNNKNEDPIQSTIQQYQKANLLSPVVFHD